MKKVIFLSIIAAYTWQTAKGQTPRIPWGRPVEAVLCEGANSTALDFSAVPSGKGILFTSNRDGEKGNDFDETEKMYCTDLWYADRLGFGKYQMAAKIPGKVNTKMHEGVASLFPGSGPSRMVYSCAIGENCEAANGKARLRLMESNNMADSWQKPIALPINLPGYASCHPTLSPDGSWLVFSSDRPGTVGGMDLWASMRNADGTWSLPVNLGSNVNTSGNELFPFFGPDGQLYFSSTGHGGKGRLDIFTAARADVNDMGSWGVPLGLAEPFNSGGDDFGFYLNKDLLSGWFSSNRGDMANDELWEWRAPARRTTVPLISGNVREENGPVLPDQIVILRNKKTNQIIKRLTSDRDGNFAFPDVDCDQDYEIVVNPDGPRTKKRDLTTMGLCDLDDIKTEKVLIELPAVKPAFVPGLAGSVKEKPSGKPLPGIKVILRNKKTGEILQTLTTDKMGEFKIPKLDCDSEYEIVVDPDGINPERRDISTKGMCDPGKKPTEVNVLVEVPLKDIVIRLDKLYYDYDKSFIRPDAAIELDKVVSFMKQYPSMVIELSSHTDSRGSDSYNLSLSQRRATAAREYIVSKGIAGERITAVGRGETMLTNQCANGVKCTDPEHERNRRTEVKVVSFSEAGVKISGQ